MVKLHLNYHTLRLWSDWPPGGWLPVTLPRLLRLFARQRTSFAECCREDVAVAFLSFRLDKPLDPFKVARPRGLTVFSGFRASTVPAPGSVEAHHDPRQGVLLCLAARWIQKPILSPRKRSRRADLEDRNSERSGHRLGRTGTPSGVGRNLI